MAQIRKMQAKIGQPGIIHRMNVSKGFPDSSPPLFKQTRYAITPGLINTSVNRNIGTAKRIIINIISITLQESFKDTLVTSEASRSSAYPSSYLVNSLHYYSTLSGSTCVCPLSRLRSMIFISKIFLVLYFNEIEIINQKV